MFEMMILDMCSTTNCYNLTKELEMAKDLNAYLEGIEEGAKRSIELLTYVKGLDREVQTLRVENIRLEAENTTLRKLMARDFKLVRKEYLF
jgi:hypothetical protein